MKSEQNCSFVHLRVRCKRVPMPVHSHFHLVRAASAQGVLFVIKQNATRVMCALLKVHRLPFAQVKWGRPLD
jgi:hypothetical protein